MSRMALLVLSLVLGQVDWAGSGEIPQAAREWKQKGLEIARSEPNSTTEAECYRKAAELCPQYADAWFNLGYVLNIQGRYGEAAEAFQKCIEHDAGRIEAYYNLGVSLAGQGQVVEARKYMSRYLELCEKQPDTCSADDRQAAQKSIHEYEQLIAEAKGPAPDYAQRQPAEIARQLQAGIKRGDSPYAGPRVPMSIQFEYNEARLTPEGRRKLDLMVAALRDEGLKQAVLRIEGHADSQGDSEYNRQLSEERAKSVRDYLQSEGIRLEMITIGFGEDQPLAPNDSEENMARNRRVEFVNEAIMKALRQQIEQSRRRGDSADLVDLLY
jgi:outer membrane protein OmpA-like peptidoglycan-associated protein